MLFLTLKYIICVLKHPINWFEKEKHAIIKNMYQTKCIRGYFK